MVCGCRSRRWNVLYRDIYHRLLFNRTLFGSTAASAALVFIWSGALHEYFNYCAFGRASGENMAFFAVHAAACLAQVTICLIQPLRSCSQVAFNPSAYEEKRLPAVAKQLVPQLVEREVPLLSILANIFEELCQCKGCVCL